MLKKLAFVFFVLALSLPTYLLTDLKFQLQRAKAADFDPNNLISNGEFTNSGSMSLQDIQVFISGRNSVLTSYIIPEGQPDAGKSPAQAIYDEGREHGVNPKVLLTMLYREQGFFSGQDPNNFLYGTDYALSHAIGWCIYSGCPYSDSDVLGFGNQIAYGTNQLRKNYDRSTDGTCKDIQTYSDRDGTTQVCANKASSSLYTYTPFIYYGNNNFWKKYNEWFGVKLYDGAYIKQLPWDEANNVNALMSPGESRTFSVTVKNTGSATWHRGTANPVHLAVVGDQYSPFLPITSEFKNNRASLLDQTSVASGETGTFTFNVTAPGTPGLYREHYQLVMEGVAWFWPDVMFTIRVPQPQGQYITQSPWDEVNNVNAVLSPGESKEFSITIKNVGQDTWYRDDSYPVNLAVLNDRHSAFLPNTEYFQNNRAARLTEASVAPGQTGTFNFTMTAPNSPGRYYEHYQFVKENSAWFFPDVMFQIIVAQPKAQYITQSPWDEANNVNVVLSPGQSADFSFTVKNTGLGTWYRDSLYPVNIAVLNDRHSDFLPNTPYFQNNRAARLTETSVAPGQLGTFNFTVTAPSDIKPGIYYEHYQFVMEGVTWFYPDMMFQIKIQ